MKPPPFSNVEVYLKQVRPPGLDERERFNLQYFFPGYENTEPKEAQTREGSVLNYLQQTGYQVTEDGQRPRRFAGDHTLPRGRYFTVCRDADGDDGGTLVAELRAYSHHNSIGYVRVIDSTNDNPDAEYLRSQWIDPGSNAIFCVPRSAPRFPSPYLAAANLRMDSEQAVVFAGIPTTLAAYKFERTIDLRFPHVQEWFTRELTTLTNPLKGGKVFQLAPPLDDFTKLLPTLLSQSLGDERRVTQIAGLWLRRIGAEALIFPSARTNAFTSFRDGRLVDFGGWNLVSYVDADPPFVQGAIDWGSYWDEFPTFMFGNPVAGTEIMAPALYTNTTITFEHEGEAKGSLRVQGLEEEREAYYRFSILEHYVERIDTQLTGLEPQKLLKLVLAMSKKDGEPDIEQVGWIAWALVGAIFGSEEKIEGLRKQIAWFDSAGHRDEAAVLETFLRLCI